MKRFPIAALSTVALLAACDGLKEALTAHVDVVATSGSQELSVQRMAEMMGKSQVPVSREVAKSIADAWVNYHLLGVAAVRGDSLTDKKLVDEVMWPAFTQARSQKFYKVLSDKFVPDTTNFEQKYNEGALLSARHILFSVPPEAAAGSDSIRKKAEGVLARTTAANFAAMAKQFGSDGTKDQGGDLGVFPASSMVAEFSQGVKAIKPGEIGPLVKTQYGYHIVRRPAYAEVSDAFKQQWLQRQRMVADSTYIANMESGAKVTIEPTAAKTIKAIAQDPAAHESDGTAVAKSIMGTFKASDVVKWFYTAPNLDQVRAQLQQVPDSALSGLVRNLLRSELILRAADSAKVDLDSTEKADIYKSFASVVQSSWAGLKISPAALGDSAKDKAGREKVISNRVDEYFNRLVNGQEQFIEVPTPLSQALRKKFEWKVNSAGLDRAVQAAQAVRAKEDSTRAAAQPKSAVPMPGDTAKK